MVKKDRIKWAGHVALMRGKRNAYNVLIGKYEGQRAVEKRRYIYGRMILKLKSIIFITTAVKTSNPI
jgi:hypothetical protein